MRRTFLITIIVHLISCASFAYTIFRFNMRSQSFLSLKSTTTSTVTNNYEFIAYTKDHMPNTLVTDCSHPSCDQITHHLKKKGQVALNDNINRGDTATHGVLNAIKSKSPFLIRNKYISCNHFDIDGFLGVWCIINQAAAMEHESLIRECATIGDFRELSLDEPWKHKALRLACWLNSEERRLFYRPYETRSKRVISEAVVVSPDTQPVTPIPATTNTTSIYDETSKWSYFLSTFKDALYNLSSSSPDPVYISQSDEEYQRVCTGYSLLHHQPLHSLSSTLNTTSIIAKHPAIGLVVIQTPEPLHYYSLFSVTRGYDIVLSIYSNNRYELECKYTTHIDLVSRPTLPRVDLQFLAVYLNRIETALYTSLHDPTTDGHNSDLPPRYEWRADKPYDSGPILRLESQYHLTKSERYGHPYERPIYPSLIPPHRIQTLVTSFLTFAYTNITPKYDWQTAGYIEFNRILEGRLTQWWGMVENVTYTVPKRTSIHL